jgi:hypothetical protein
MYDMKAITYIQKAEKFIERAKESKDEIEIDVALNAAQIALKRAIENLTELETKIKDLI